MNLYLPTLHGTEIIPVDAGTAIKNKETGETLVVDENNAVVKRGRIYVTWKMWAKLKERLKAQTEWTAGT